jgi:hypothetical protein
MQANAIQERLAELEKKFKDPPQDPRDWLDSANDFRGILESGVKGKEEGYQQQIGKTIDAFLSSLSKAIASDGGKHGSIVPSLSLIEKSLKDLGLDSLGPEFLKRLRERYAYLGGVSNPPKTTASG